MRKTRALRILLLSALALSPAAMAAAQDVPATPPSETERDGVAAETPSAAGAGPTAEPSAEAVPEAAVEATDPLADAFARLKSDDEAVWRAAQGEIAKAWTRSGSPSMDLLLRRSREAIDAEEWAAALTHLDDLVNLAPSFAEAWNLRATAHFRQGDYGAALADLAEAIGREPRHFAALAGLGVIFMEIGRDKEALAAFRAALALHPNLDAPTDAIERLSKAVDGVDA